MKLFIKKIKTSKTCIHKKAFFITIILSILIMSLLTGCGNTIKNEEKQSDNISSETPENSVKQNTEKTDTENSSYQITTAKFNKDSILIEYPQIEGLGNDSVEHTINELIKNDIWDSQVDDVTKSYEEDGSTINLNVDLKYQVTISTDELLSVMYTGTSYVEGGMYVNNVFHGITIDLVAETGNLLLISLKLIWGLSRRLSSLKKLQMMQ